MIVVTLVLQGTTLPAVARRLKLPPDDPMQDALAEATCSRRPAGPRQGGSRSRRDGAPGGVVERLRQAHSSTLATSAWERLGGAERETPSQAYVRLRREMLDAERDVFRQARDAGRIPEEVLVRAQRDMDLEESMLERGRDVSCEHMRGAASPTPQTADGLPGLRREGVTDWVHLRLCLDCGHVGLLRLVAAPARHRALRATPATR